MTTFQAIVYATIHGLSQFLPISAKAHNVLVPYLIDWQPPTGALLGAFALGTLLSILIYFRHDWASMISSFLQIIIYRKRPMTLDERLPLFLMVTSIPIGVASYYANKEASDWGLGTLATAGIYAGLGVVLGLVDSWGRKIKGTFDWKWSDAILVGVIQCIGVLPGGDPMTGILIGAFFLNYRREAAAKYAYFASAPILVGMTINHLEGVTLHAPSPMPDLSWLSFSVAVPVSCLVGLLAIGGFMRHVQQKGMGQYVAYRILLALGVCVTLWLRSS